MASFRKPKGVYQRSTPDWFVASLGVAFGFIPTPVLGQASLGYISLFNDGSKGELLYVYTILGSFDGGNVTILSSLHGTHGTFYQQGTSIFMDGPSFPGAIYVDNNYQSNTPGQNTPFIGTPFAAIGQQYDSGANAWPSHPLAIVPPGWSLVTFGDQRNTIAQMSFYYTVMTDRA